MEVVELRHELQVDFLASGSQTRDQRPKKGSEEDNDDNDDDDEDDEDEL